MSSKVGAKHRLLSSSELRHGWIYDAARRFSMCGVSAHDGVSTLRFDLRDSRDNTLYLFDSETQEYVEITDGTELPIDGTSTGRYYLCQSPIEDSLNADLQNDTRKGVWTVGGAYLGESVRNLAPGVYVVNGVKVVVR